jgi:hypothetical protein
MADARADVVVCFVLSVRHRTPYAFSGIFYQLFESNPGLLQQAACLQIVSSGSQFAQRGEEAKAIAEDYIAKKQRQAPVHLFKDRSMGRCLNDAFLWVVAADKAAHWLVWDDAHACTRPFTLSARLAMERPLRWPLWQLMLDGSWTSDLPLHRRVPEDGFDYVLSPSRDALESGFLDHAASESWPGFVLSPAWHRLEFLREAVARGDLGLKPFPESSFESWETLLRSFGDAWLRAGAMNAELVPSPSCYCCDAWPQPEPAALV